MGRNGMWRWLAVLVLLCGSGACVGVMRQMGAAPSPGHAPPRSWQSGVKFVFGDPKRFANVRHSTRVDFVGAGRRWSVTNRDLFVTDARATRTAWYPLRPREQPVELYFTVEHPGGVRTVAQFPLTVRRDEFYTVSAQVYTRRPAPAHHPDLGFSAPLPLHPNAGAEPGDSLWIFVHTTPGDCFDCPT